MKNMIKRIIVGVSIALIVGSINACEVHAANIYNTTKIGNQDFGLTNSLSANTSSEIAYNLNISITYDNPSDGWGLGTEANDKYDYFKSYNSSNASAPKKILYYFYVGYCSNVGRSLTAIYNYYNNSIAVNHNTGQTCYVNQQQGEYYVAYIKMTPTYNNCGTQGEAQCEIRFNNILGVKSQYTYNGYIGFQAFVDISEDNFTSATDTLKIIGTQNTLVNQNQTIINQQNQINTNISNTTNAINDQTNFLKDTSLPNASQYDFSSNNASNNVISNLITMPIRLVQSFMNGFNSSCSPFVLGNLYGSNLSLPCINLSNRLGVLWNMIDVIISGLFIYVFGKSCVKKFNDITNMKDNQIDEVFD